MEGIIAGVAGRYTGGITECDGQDCSDNAKKAFADAVALGQTNPDDPGAIVDDPDTEGDERVFPERKVHANFTADVYAGYTFNTSFGSTTLQAGINNVFNSPPPKIFNGFLANSDASTYDYIGRWFYVGLRHAL
jgi:hypothetical protein